MSHNTLEEKPYLIDSHCHLDSIKKIDVKSITDQCSELSIKKLITISVEPNNMDVVDRLSKEYKSVFCSQGIHPHDAKDYNPLIDDKIKENFNKNEKVVAIGEIGLDYHYNFSEKSEQIFAFESQLLLASKMDLPIIVHTREAEKDTMDILERYLPNLKKKGVLHSFTSSLQMAKWALTKGLLLGFNGIITFKKAEEVREVLRITPLEKILIETDSPYLAPHPHRGKENTPLFLPEIAKKVAEIKNVSFEEVARKTSENANALFSI